MKIDIPSFDKPKCEEKYSLLNIDLLDSQICAGGENARDSCTGDSGGPLMMTPNATVWYAAGIVSYGIGCGTEDWPGVYTSIPSFIPWIKQTIKENSLVSVKNKPVKKHRRKKVKAAPRTL
ncbi:hypothetical protein JTB14_007355 [Gonioctena quinquepunctata]|nr:hypothetical protein JTB14_007355 [Gonioctena quinquepunctata]